MSYKAVVFDLDGTLVNSLQDLAQSANAMLTSYGLPTHAIEQYRYFVGNGSRKLIERILPEAKRTDVNFVNTALAKYKAIYAQQVLQTTKPYDGILELLVTLKKLGLKLGVCTNKPMEDAKEIVSVLFNAHTFEAIIGDREGVPPKPNPANALAVAEALQVAPSEVLYLGDSSVDMETAKNANFFAVGVLWGFRDADELRASGAQVLLHTPMELLHKVAIN